MNVRQRTLSQYFIETHAIPSFKDLEKPLCSDLCWREVIKLKLSDLFIREK